jgi:hypothetical protein
MRTSLFLTCLLAGLGCSSEDVTDDGFWDGGEDLCERAGRSSFFEVAGGEFWMCDFPDPTTGEVDVLGYDGNTSLVNGATVAFELDWHGPPVTGKTLILGVLEDGFYRVPVEEGTYPYPMDVEILQTVSSDFDLWVGFADAFDEGGHPIVGETLAIPIRITQVLTGDVQININWNTPNDVDLHVIDPTGFEIFYGQPSSPSGGTLDLDSNAACYIDGVNNENIYWPEDGAPAGEYTVRADLWASCDGQGVRYRVTVVRGGQDVTTHDGTFSPEDASAGGLGAGELVTTFTWDP